LGKAITGMFYITLLSVWFYAFYWAYVTNWGLALVGFLLMALFSVGLALMVGNMAKTTQHVNLIGMVILVFLLLPALFAQETFLNLTLKAIFPWVPSSALSYLIRLSFSQPAPLNVLFTNLAIALGSILIIYLIVIWQVRRSDR